MRTCCTRPVPRSFASTRTMPFSSMRNVTWIFGHAARRRRDAGELEAREAAVVGGHLALALEDVDRHEVLVVDAGREDLALLGGDGRVARDELGA